MAINNIRSIVRMLILESVGELGFKMIFLAGLPGGGKSTLLKQLGIQDQFTTCNIDNFFEPKLMDELGTKNLHDFSQRFFDLRAVRDGRPLTPEELEEYEGVKALRGKERTLFRAAIKDFKAQVNEICMIGSNFIVDGTAANYDMITSDAERFRNAGYDCAMIFVDIDPETSKERNLNRGAEGGRSIYTGIIDDQASRLPGHLEPYREFFGEGRFFLVPNKGTFDEYKDQIEKIRPGINAFMGA